MVIFSKVAVCKSQPVVVNWYLSTRGHLTGLRKKASAKADPSTFYTSIQIIC